MGGNITFEDIYVSPFRGVSINGLHIEDSNKDTLLYAESFLLELGEFNLKELNFRISSLRLENGFYNLYSINEREQTNMQYIFNFFSSSEPKDTTKTNFYLDADYVDIKNLRFKYKRLNPDSVDYGINFGEVYLQKFDLEAQDFKMINDSMNLDIINISLNEKSGFKLEKLQGHAIISSTEITVNNLVLKTPVSNVFASNYSMRYKHWKEMSDFLNNVNLELNLQLSSVNISDIAFFAPIFKGINLPTFVRGRIYGPISNLRSKRLLVSMGKDSRIETRFSMQGLPNVEETFLSLDIKKIDLCMADVEAFLAIQKDSVKKQIPELLKRVGDLSYRGNVTGFLNDLVAYGTFKNIHGVLDTDVRFKYNPNEKSFLYSGKVNTKGLDLSLLNLSDTLFDKVTMSAEILVEVDSLENIKGDLEGKIASIGINNYDYKNIKVLANLEDLILNSTLEVNDTNIYVNVDSEIDFSLNEPYFDIEAELKNAYLSKINWIDRDSSSNLSFRVDAQFSSVKLNKFFGEFVVDSLIYIEKEDTVFAEAINLQSTKNEERRLIEVESDLLRASFEGDFLIEDLVKQLKQMSYSYLPSFITNYDDKELPEQELKYEINLKNTYSLFQIFSPHFVLANQTLLKGNYSSVNDRAVMYFETDSCRIDDYYAENIEVKINGNYEKLNSNIEAEYFRFSDELFFKNITLENTLESDSLSVFLGWKNDSSKQIEDAEIMAEVIFNPSEIDSVTPPTSRPSSWPPRAERSCATTWIPRPFSSSRTGKR